MKLISLSEVASVIRSKNSGPYELTLDIIFNDKKIFNAACKEKVITESKIAELYGINEEQVISIVEFAPANAIKLL
ncbi:hypothetical protein N752_24105 [Desulforamulus aquiferis]|nr:DUF4387 family protein [Desulforamulus aquiferis]RYD02417.1 hypothetical protein N752_24105 [Desulforamulus aquiferis]